ncbi:MAG: hypothetical protein ABIJ91_00475 [Candidatus Kuenenbacteria bacterium]
MEFDQKINATSNNSNQSETAEQVKCSIFQAKNEFIASITKIMNEMKDIKNKAHLAERLIEEVEKLLACKQFDKQRAECEICHHIAVLRKQAADLIIQAENLDLKI